MQDKKIDIKNKVIIQYRKIIILKTLKLSFLIIKKYHPLLIINNC
jgi:hypothetical protein